MAFEITDELKRAAQGNMWTSPERLCLTSDDEIVSQDDPRATRLLVGKNCQITKDEARKYGLLLEDGEKAAKPQEDKERKPAEDKSAIPAAPSTKSLAKMNKNELLAELATRGIEDTSGANGVIVARIKAHDAAPPFKPEPEAPQE